MRPTLFEFAGGEPAFVALAAAHHARCLADPELAHPFSHADLDPEHVTRLAANWADVIGAPPRWSRELGVQAALLRLHDGNGEMGALGRRFVDWWVTAADDAGLPRERRFRDALRAYME